MKLHRMKLLSTIHAALQADRTLSENLIFAIASLVLWTLFATGLGINLLEHNPTDHHTRMAIAWQEGRITIDEHFDPELVERDGRYIVSFPPTVTMIEFPFTLIFGRATPNTLVMFLAAWGAMCLGFLIIRKSTGNFLLSVFMAMAFFWGTQVMYLSVHGSVHHQGQIFGIFFLVLSYYIALFKKTPRAGIWAGLDLSLAVGCRPIMLAHLPFLLYLAIKDNPKSFLRTAFLWCCGLAPMGIFIATYNFARFGSIFEFGHNLLPDSVIYHIPQFSLKFMPRNLWHNFVQPPIWDTEYNVLSVDGLGTAFYYSAPAYLLALPWFFKRSVSPVAKGIAGFIIVTIWFSLLMHRSNGWYQFGLRYTLDMMPLFMVLAAHSFRRLHWSIPLLVLWAVPFNMYGVYWKYFSPLGHPKHFYDISFLFK